MSVVRDRVIGVPALGMPERASQRKGRDDVYSRAKMTKQAVRGPMRPSARTGAARDLSPVPERLVTSPRAARDGSDLHLSPQCNSVPINVYMSKSKQARQAVGEAPGKLHASEAGGAEREDAGGITRR